MGNKTLAASSGTPAHQVRIDMREATIHVPHHAFGESSIGAVVSRCAEAGLRDLAELACEGDGCLFVVTLDEELEGEELDDVTALEWWEQLTVSERGATYLCKLSDEDLAESLDAVRELDVSTTGIEVGDTGIDFSIVGSRTAIARSVEAYDDVGMDVDLRKLSEYTGPETTFDVVTDRQREILETAYELGYFEVPRRASAADVAAELDLDTSTVTEHVRRAEQNLFSDVFG